MAAPERNPQAPRPRDPKLSMASHLIANGFVAAALLAWWSLSLKLPDYVMPGPIAVGHALLDIFLDPRQLSHVLASTLRIVAAVALALLLGGLLALLPRIWPVLRPVVDDLIRPVFGAVPAIGWAVLVAIWLSMSDATVILVQVAILTPFCLINLDEGLKEFDREIVEMGRSFTRDRRRMLLHIYLPLLAPYLFAALRMAYGVGWKLALVAEMFGANRGIGFLMLQAQTVGDAAAVYATCFAVVGLFVAGDRLVLNPLSRLVVAKET